MPRLVRDCGPDRQLVNHRFSGGRASGTTGEPSSTTQEGPTSGSSAPRSRVCRARHERLVEVDDVGLDDPAGFERAPGDGFAAPIGATTRWREVRRRADADDAVRRGPSHGATCVHPELAQAAGQVEHLALHHRTPTVSRATPAGPASRPRPAAVRRESLGQFGWSRCHCSVRRDELLESVCELLVTRPTSSRRRPSRCAGTAASRRGARSGRSTPQPREAALRP